MTMMIKKNVPFETMLRETLLEYASNGNLKKAAKSKSMAMRMAAAFVHGARVFDIDPSYPEMGEQDGEVFCMGDGSSLMRETDDYIKAWFLMELLAREYDLPGAERIAIHVHVSGEKAKKQPRMMNELVAAMANASKNDTWKKCRGIALDHLEWFHKVDPMYIYSLTYFKGSVQCLSTPA